MPAWPNPAPGSGRPGSRSAASPPRPRRSCPVSGPTHPQGLLLRALGWGVRRDSSGGGGWRAVIPRGSCRDPTQGPHLGHLCKHCIRGVVRGPRGGWHQSRGLLQGRSCGVPLKDTSLPGTSRRSQLSETPPPCRRSHRRWGAACVSVRPSLLHDVPAWGRVPLSPGFRLHCAPYMPLAAASGSPSPRAPSAKSSQPYRTSFSSVSEARPFYFIPMSPSYHPDPYHLVSRLFQKSRNNVKAARSQLLPLHYNFSRTQI